MTCGSRSALAAAPVQRASRPSRAPGCQNSAAGQPLAAPPRSGPATLAELTKRVFGGTQSHVSATPHPHQPTPRDVPLLSRPPNPVARVAPLGVSLDVHVGFAEEDSAARPAGFPHAGTELLMPTPGLLGACSRAQAGALRAVWTTAKSWPALRALRALRALALPLPNPCSAPPARGWEGLASGGGYGWYPAARAATQSRPGFQRSGESTSGQGAVTRRAPSHRASSRIASSAATACPEARENA
jgi:hypothetical protein